MTKCSIRRICMTILIALAPWATAMDVDQLLDRVEDGYVDSDGVNIHYVTIGDGPLVLVVPTLFSHLRLSYEQPSYAAMMATLGRGRRQATFDWRGTGLSDSWEGAHSVDCGVRDIEAVVRALGEEELSVIALGEGGRTSSTMSRATQGAWIVSSCM